MPHRDMPRGDIQNHFWDEKGVKPGCSVSLGKIAHLIQKSLQATDTRPPNHTDAVGIQFIKCKRRIGNRFICNGYCIMYKCIYLTGLFALHEIFGIEPLNLTGKACLEFRSVKLRDRSSD